MARTADKPEAPAVRAPESGSLKPDTMILALGAFAVFSAYIAVELGRNRVPGFPLDDPWIHLKFAHSLARGWGFAFNQGEPVAGSTAPLWTLILAFCHLFLHPGIGMVWVAKLLGAGFLFLAAWYGYRLTRELTDSRALGLFTGLVLTTYCHFGWAMVSGMEVTLLLTLLLAGLYYYAAPTRGMKAFLPWVLFALAAYARPEAFLLGMFLVLASIIRRLVFRQRVLFWRGLAIYLAVTVPYFLLNLSLAHALFPQTYLAKVGRTSLFAALATLDMPQIGLLLFKAPFLYFGGFVAHLMRGNPAIALLALIGLAGLVRDFARRRSAPGVLVPLIVLGYAPLVGMTAPFVSPFFQNGRYIAPPTALVVVCAALGIGMIAGRMRTRRFRLGIVAVLLALVGFNAVTTGVATAVNTARAASSINRQQVALARWLAENTAKDTVIACNDVGAIGYFADRKVLDVLGLVTPEVAQFRRKRPIGQENLGALDYIYHRKPDYLVIFPNWFPNLEKARFLSAVHVSDLTDNFASEYDFVPRARTIAGLLITGLEVEPIRAVMVVFKCDWSEVRPGAP